MRYFLFALPLALLACQNAEVDNTTKTPDPEAQQAAGLGHCIYTNRFSKMEECREYKGDGWSVESVSTDCKAQDGTIQAGTCDYATTLGTCVLTLDETQEIHVIAPGNDASVCSGLKMGCEVFGGGKFEPSAVCTGEPPPPDPNASVFHWPELICKDPIAGEPPGQSANGQVCTWSMIGACTEPGRKFADYVSCDPVWSQRPYYPVPPAPPPAEPDARMKDPAYVEELNWVKTEVEACGCVCCHQGSKTPQGASVWDIEAMDNWVNTFTPYGLAVAGGFLDSWPLGAYSAEDNNGFARDTTGIPSTNPARMAAFFGKELLYRGINPSDYLDDKPIPEVLYDQVMYTPSACADGEGVAEDGTIQWGTDYARYIYVLEKDAKSPGVPPNLDLPEGTLMRIDVSPKAAPLKSGTVKYGELPANSVYGYPKDGSAPPALKKGEVYYLYVLADIAAPVTRCLFQY